MQMKRDNRWVPSGLVALLCTGLWRPHCVAPGLPGERDVSPANATVSLASATRRATVSPANATVLGPNVYVFDPSMPAADVQRTATDIFKKMEANQFGPERYALLFKPGTYNVTFNVGFYTQVAGLGASPDDVQINGGVNVNAKWSDGNALDNFWRSLENFAVTPSSDVPFQTMKGVTRIAVSQAAPLRRLHVKGELQLFDWGPKGTWVTPAAVFWPTRSWMATSFPGRSSSGSPATAGGPGGTTPCGTWSSWAATTRRRALSQIRPTPWSR